MTPDDRSEVHEHFTERINRARLKLEIARAARPLVTVVVGAAVGLACLAYIISNVAQQSVKDTYQLRFAVDDARAIVAGRDDVRVKGIKAGTITKVEMVDQQPTLTVKVRSEFGEVYRDVRAAVRPRTPLQDMYLDIVDRGTRSAGVATANVPIPARQTDTSVNVAEVLQAFNPEVRAHLAAVLRDLGGGLEDRGASLRTAFAELVPTLKVAEHMTRQLGDRSAKTRRLVNNLSVLTAELARRDRSLRRLANDGATTLRTLADGSEDLDATLAGLPPTLRRIDSSFAAVRGTLGDVNAAVGALRPVARALPQSLRDVRRLSADARPAVRALRTPVRRLVPLARALRPVALNLSRAMTALRPQIGAIEHATKSAAGCMTAVQRFFQWTPSVFKLGDARGPGPRADVTIGIDSGALSTDPRVFKAKSCAPGGAVGGRPGPGGTLTPDPQGGGGR